MKKFNERNSSEVEFETKLQEAQRMLTYAVENIVGAKRIAKAESDEAGKLAKAEEFAEFARAIIFEIRS